MLDLAMDIRAYMNHCTLPPKNIQFDQTCTGEKNYKRKKKKKGNDYRTVTSDMDLGRGGLFQKYQWLFLV